ncbi:MAG: efflux RND transporter periplasmic adaptor subunit [Candidatus Doudnabacteria bacterium]|nr:efflux RND transporter periplasmic adaptor subunit [Candidatus Doudnabacteria bacterium]
MDNSKPEDQIVKAVENTEGKIEKTERGILQNKWVRSGGAVVSVLVVVGALLYWQMSSTRVGIDTSLISAPVIDLSPTAPGQLEEIFVNEGDMVAANAPVAKVGDEIIKAKIAGEIISVQNNIGKSFNPGQTVVSMIDRGQLRVIGTIDENKGLDQIHVGQLASFTVDAFGSKQYQGVVDEISPSSNQSDVVFNISSQREEQQFNVKVRFNTDAYPELKNGMSAKLTIFTK